MQASPAVKTSISRRAYMRWLAYRVADVIPWLVVGFAVGYSVCLFDVAAALAGAGN